MSWIDFNNKFYYYPTIICFKILFTSFIEPSFVINIS